MARDKGLLSDLQLRHWIKAGTPLAKADGNGLTFTLSTAGVAGWILRYRHGGRRRELTIGRYPDISLADARGIATIKRAEIMQGRNPAADKQKAKATAAKDWTVRELVKDYRAKKLVSLAHSTQVSYGRHLKRVEKKLGALTVREIEASDVVALVEASGLTWGESNMLLITTKCLFTHACGKRLINANPCHGIMLSALLGERPPKRKRLMLTREELHLLLNAGMRRRNALKRPFQGSDPQLRVLDSYLLVDEADNIMRYEFDVLRKVLLQGREFGTGVILASQYLRHFKVNATDYREPLLTWFIHKVPNVTAAELGALGFTSDLGELVDRVKTLPNHQCLFKSFNAPGDVIRGTPFYELKRPDATR